MSDIKVFPIGILSDEEVFVKKLAREFLENRSGI
jgi:hypothetical protein